MVTMTNETNSSSKSFWRKKWWNLTLRATSSALVRQSGQVQFKCFRFVFEPMTFAESLGPLIHAFRFNDMPFSQQYMCVKWIGMNGSPFGIWPKVFSRVVLSFSNLSAMSAIPSMTDNKTKWQLMAICSGHLLLRSRWMASRWALGTFSPYAISALLCSLFGGHFKPFDW